MNEVVFDLAVERAPLRRLAIHGLWRLLFHGEGQDRYPGVERVDGLDWRLEDRRVVLQYRSLGDLDRLLGVMTGDLRDGFAVPPGYEGDPGAAGVYASVRFHQAMLGSWLFARKGTRRSKSAQQRSQVSPCEDRSSTAENPRYVTMGFTRHLLPEPGERLVVGADKLQSLGSVVHPAFAMWNNENVRATALDRFLLSFAALSYVVTRATGGPVALGVDLPTFSEADARHRAWASSRDPRNVLWVHGSEWTAAAFLADSLGLPAGFWQVISDRFLGPYAHGQQGLDLGSLHSVLGSALVPRTRNKLIHATEAIPVQTRMERLGKKGRWVVVTSALDVLLENVRLSRPFYAGLEGLATVVRDTHVGLWPREQAVLETFFERMETSMERRVRIRMKTMFGALVRAEKDRFGTSWADARERARDYALKVRLRRAARGADLLMALDQIRDRASSSFFDQEEMDWMVTLAERDPEMLRALLCVACETRSNEVVPDASDVPATDDFQDD